MAPRSAAANSPEQKQKNALTWLRLWHAGLCDTVPACMNARVPSLTGTSLISANNSFGTTGALCDARNVSTCLPADGCGCVNLTRYSEMIVKIC